MFFNSIFLAERVTEERVKRTKICRHASTMTNDRRSSGQKTDLLAFSWLGEKPVVPSGFQDVGMSTNAVALS